MKGRRQSDARSQRLLVLFISLTLASSLFSVYLGYRAINAMDVTSRYAVDAYIMGKATGKGPKYAPISPENE